MLIRIDDSGIWIGNLDNSVMLFPRNETGASFRLMANRDQDGQDRVDVLVKFPDWT